MSEIRVPCTVCYGEKIVRDGEMYRQCSHCGGTGDEPPPKESDLEAAGQTRLL